MISVSCWYITFVLKQPSYFKSHSAFRGHYSRTPMGMTKCAGLNVRKAQILAGNTANYSENYTYNISNRPYMYLFLHRTNSISQRFFCHTHWTPLPPLLREVGTLWKESTNTGFQTFRDNRLSGIGSKWEEEKLIHCKWMSGSYLCIPRNETVISKTKVYVLSPSSYTHISVRDLYISRIGMPCLFCCREICGPILGMYKSLNVEIGTEAAQFPEKEYINGIFLAVYIQITYNSSTHVLNLYTCSET